MTEDLYSVAVACPGWIIGYAPMDDGASPGWTAYAPYLGMSERDSLAASSAVGIVASVFEVETGLYAAVAEAARRTSPATTAEARFL